MRSVTISDPWPVDAMVLAETDVALLVRLKMSCAVLKPDLTMIVRLYPYPDMSSLVILGAEIPLTVLTRLPGMPLSTVIDLSAFVRDPHDTIVAADLCGSNLFLDVTCLELPALSAYVEGRLR